MRFIIMLNEILARVGWSELANSNIYCPINMLLDFLRQSTYVGYSLNHSSLEILACCNSFRNKPAPISP
jgi:hypothetical protein